MRNRRVGLLLLSALVLGAGLGLLLHGPIRQDAGYHAFADERTLLRIPNALNVLSNAPFLAAGALGIAVASRETARSRIAWLAFFASIVLTGFGSAWYHLRPSDETLFWDRLPMTLAFMSLFTAVLAERVDASLARLLVPLLFLGAGSVLLWRLSGDLRLYAFVQYTPLAALVVLLFFFEPRFSHGSGFGLVIAGYAAAKLFEFLDAPAYRLGHVVSGHTLKHLVSSLATLALVAMLRRREVIEATGAW